MFLAGQVLIVLLDQVKKILLLVFIIIFWLFLMILGAVLFSLQSFFCIELLSKLLNSYIIGTFILLKNLSHVNQIDSESGSVILLTLRPKLLD